MLCGRMISGIYDKAYYDMGTYRGAGKGYWYGKCCEIIKFYAAGAIVLLLSDIINEPVIFERERLEQLGVPVTIYGMPADIILYQEVKKWLYLIRVGTSFRFISHRRRRELEKLLERCSAELIYISAFPNFAEYLRYAIHIAWGSHVWIAEVPEHMIHYNGNMLLEMRSFS